MRFLFGENEEGERKDEKGKKETLSFVLSRTIIKKFGFPCACRNISLFTQLVRRMWEIEKDERGSSCHAGIPQALQTMNKRSSVSISEVTSPSRILSRSSNAKAGKKGKEESKNVSRLSMH